MSRRRDPATIWDIARETGLSKSTVARVIAGKGSSSSSAQELVAEAARRLGYRPNGIARAMASGSSQTIGAVIPDVASPFFSVVLRGLADTSRAAEFEVILSNTDNDREVEARALDVLTQKRVDGLVVAPVFAGDEARIREIVEGGTPVVLFDRRLDVERPLPLVALDHAGASALAVDHLVALGHRRIAILTEAVEDVDRIAEIADARIESGLRPSSQRLLGYVRSLRRHGLPVDPLLVIRSGFDAGDAGDAVRAALDGGIDATALYCTDSVLTLGAYRALVARGTSIPDELSFVGFDDQDWTTLVEPGVTVVDQPRRRLGNAAAELLLRLIADPEAAVSDVLLKASLVVRGSTAPHPTISGTLPRSPR